MKIKVNLKKIACYTVLFYPVIYAALCIVSEGLLGTLLKITTVFFLILNLDVIVSKRSANQIVHLCLIVFVFVLNLFLFKLTYVQSSDFIGFILILLVMNVFCEESYLEELKELINNDRVFFLTTILYFSIIILSLVFKEGFRYSNSFGSLPILYGPYDYPHCLSYSLIIYYCLSSMRFRMTKHKIFLGIMILCSVCAVWTGVRSGILSLMVIILCDYLSIRKSYFNIIIALVVFMVIAVLLFSTDILYSNPIVNKTTQAIANGSISNGRENFSSVVMNYYNKNTDIFEKITGISVKKIREVLTFRYGPIHAHNEFVNVLVGFGFIGIAFYLFDFIRFCKKSSLWLLPFLAFGILAFTNGLYMYTMFTPSMPIVIIFFRTIFENKGSKIQNQIQIGKLRIKK